MNTNTRQIFQATPIRPHATILAASNRYRAAVRDVSNPDLPRHLAQIYGPDEETCRDMLNAVTQCLKYRGWGWREPEE